MSLTTQVFINDLAIQLGDPSNSLWPRTQLLSFLKRAYRISSPWFFTPVVDETTYTGLNAVPINTNEVSVPNGFKATGSLTEVAMPGEVTGIKVRLTGTTTPVAPVPQVWFPVAHAEIDPLTLSNPLIRFLQPFNNIFEMKLFGWIPLTIPQTDDNVTYLAGSDTRGFLEWLTYQCMVYAMAARETSTNEDKRGFGRRHLLDQADADKLRWRYRMPKQQYTTFSLIAR